MAETATDDATWMRRAVELAWRSRPSPNPRVGAVVVREGRLVGEGFHEGPGNDHAEVRALKAAGEASRGATVYTTLEPCNHEGRTPPCTRALHAAGVARVVAGVRDPNPHVTGGGLDVLRSRGIVVDEGVEAAACATLVRAWSKHVRSARPYVVLKTAMSLDGRTATRTRESKWITGTAARRDAHSFRARADAVVVGIGTVLADDPSLTPREVALPIQGAPLRVVIDTHARTPLGAAVVKTARETRTCIVHAPDADVSRLGALREAGCETLAAALTGGRVDLSDACRQLGERGLVELFVEGGSTLHGGFIDAALVDAVVCYVAPVIVGGRDALPAFGGLGAAELRHALRVARLDVASLGDDLRIAGEVEDVHGNRHGDR